jgi:hypothetical protein
MTRMITPMMASMRRRGSFRRRRWLRRSLTAGVAAGVGAAFVEGAATWLSGILGLNLRRILLQVLLHTLLGIADRAGKFHLRQIVRVQAGNVIFVCIGNRFLCLHDFKVVGYTC